MSEESTDCIDTCYISASPCADLRQSYWGEKWKRPEMWFFFSFLWSLGLTTCKNGETLCGCMRPWAILLHIAQDVCFFFLFLILHQCFEQPWFARYLICWKIQIHFHPCSVTFLPISENNINTLKSPYKNNDDINYDRLFIVDHSNCWSSILDAVFGNCNLDTHTKQNVGEENIMPWGGSRFWCRALKRGESVLKNECGKTQKFWWTVCAAVCNTSVAWEELYFSAKPTTTTTTNITTWFQQQH